MRFGPAMFALLAACAACAAAAFAHVAIDIVGDYALPHDTYDNIAHNSRDLITAIALAVAAVVAWRGLRLCCDVAAANRGRLPVPAIGKLRAGAFVLCTAVAASILVPAMEFLDGRLDGTPVAELDDAFGGSILLGLGTTIVCAAIVAFLLLAIARWLVSHRDSIATMLGSLVARDTSAPAASVALRRHIARPQKRRTAPALRRCKRGPPNVAFVSSQRLTTFLQGDPRESTTLTRVARAARPRDRAFICRAHTRGRTLSLSR